MQYRPLPAEALRDGGGKCPQLLQDSDQGGLDAVSPSLPQDSRSEGCEGSGLQIKTLLAPASGVFSDEKKHSALAGQERSSYLSLYPGFLFSGPVKASGDKERPQQT